MKIKELMYRLNYGNGQVSHAFGTFKEVADAFSELKVAGVPYVRFLRIQRYIGEGEWETQTFQHDKGLPRG